MTWINERRGVSADAGDPEKGSVMFEVRIHGRGGQGVVTAAEMLTIGSLPQSSRAAQKAIERSTGG
jgi:hypothetical protein